MQSFRSRPKPPKKTPKANKDQIGQDTSTKDPSVRPSIDLVPSLAPNAEIGIRNTMPQRKPIAGKSKQRTKNTLIDRFHGKCRLYMYMVQLCRPLKEAFRVLSLHFCVSDSNPGGAWLDVNVQDVRMYMYMYSIKDGKNVKGKRTKGGWGKKKRGGGGGDISRQVFFLLLCTRIQI